MKKTTGKHAAVLRQYMDATGSTVIDVAKRTGLTRAFIYMVLNGQCNVGFGSARKFKRSLGIGLDKWMD